MHRLDWILIAAYLGGTFLLSAAFARRQQNPDDYFVGGRRIPWWALGISMLATQSSANSFLGIPAYVALVPGGGLTWLQYELALPIAMLVIGTVLVPPLRGRGLVSVYEFLEGRFDRRTRRVLSAVFLLSRGLATGVATYAAALVVHAIADVPLPWAVVLVGGLTLVYDTLGGMQAVVWTDVLQMAVLLVGIGVCAWVAWPIAAPEGLAALWNGWDPARRAVFGSGTGLGDGARAPLWGFVVGGLALYVAYYGVDQSQAQRLLSAPSVRDARRALTLNAWGRFPLTLGYAALGILLAGAYARLPALQAAVPPTQPDQLVPRFITLALPTGLRGLLVASLLAAAMSSLDSALNSLSAATLRDFVEPRLAAAHQRRRLLAARGVTVGWGLAITAMALAVPWIGGGVIELINRVGALFYGPLLAAFLCGVLDRRATGPGVLIGTATGLGANLALAAWFGTEVFYLWWNVTGLLSAAVVTVAVGLLGSGNGHASASPPPARADHVERMPIGPTVAASVGIAALLWFLHVV